jgi:guanosine-3',5'-bis(diphosphate) 3'-pyrophosphohydrolase
VLPAWEHVLQNGDHVDIIRSKNQKPKRDWLSFVVTSKARSKIKLALNEEKARAAAEGKEMLMRRLKNWKIPYGDTVIQKLINNYNVKTAQDLYFLIETGKIELLEIKEVLQKEQAPHSFRQITIPADKDLRELVDTQYTDFLIVEDRVEGLDYKLAKCCNPVFGDSVFGFVTISEGIKIHRTSCPNAHYMMSKYPYRVVSARWTKATSSTSFIASIKITGVEETGIVNRIADIVSSYTVTMRSFNYKMDEGMFEGVLNLSVSNNDVLYGIIRKIQSIKGVLKVNRVNN